MRAGNADCPDRHGKSVRGTVNSRPLCTLFTAELLYESNFKAAIGSGFKTLHSDLYLGENMTNFNTKNYYA